MAGKIYYYKVVYDTGGAPCVEYGLLSLALCKPVVRRVIHEGDYIVGIASKALKNWMDTYRLDKKKANGPFGDIIYIARVSKRISDGRYYSQASYFYRSDCIYLKNGNQYLWRPNSRHHTPTNPSNAQKDFSKDFDDIAKGGPHALLSADYVYFGSNAANVNDSGFGLTPDQQETLKKLFDNIYSGHRVDDTTGKSSPDALSDDDSARHQALSDLIQNGLKRWPDNPSLGGPCMDDDLYGKSLGGCDGCAPSPDLSDAGEVEEALFVSTSPE